MAKKIIVSCCDECPYLYEATYGNGIKYFCTHIKCNEDEVENMDIIQEWCPLEDE